MTAEAEDTARRGEILQVRAIAGRERGGRSSWQSLRRCAGSIESDYLNGEIVLLGRLHGVSAPVNDLLRRTARRMVDDGAAPGTADAFELLRALG